MHFSTRVPTGSETCQSPLSRVLAWHLVLITPWLSTCPRTILRFKETTTCKIYGELQHIPPAMLGFFFYFLAFKNSDVSFQSPPQNNNRYLAMNSSTIIISGILHCQHVVINVDINSLYDLWQRVSIIWRSSSGRPLP